MSKDSDKQKAKAASKARGDAARAAGAGKTLTYPTKAAALAASQARGNANRGPAPKSTTKKVAAKSTPAKATASGNNFLYMKPFTAPGKKAASKASTSKAAALAASKARGDAARAAGAGKKLSYPNKAAALAASKARGNAARAGKTTATGKKAAASPGRKALTAADKFMQGVANKRDVFKATEADPAGWASIAMALGNAGDPRFAAYSTGSRGTSEAKAYVAGNKSKNKGPS